jgi:flagellar basal-body rod protein FlgF
MERPGWIAVQGENGAEAYTRAGDLRMMPEGQLQTGAGQSVTRRQRSTHRHTAGTENRYRSRTVPSVSFRKGSNATISVLVSRIKMVNTDLTTIWKNCTDGLMYL